MAVNAVDPLTGVDWVVPYTFAMLLAVIVRALVLTTKFTLPEVTLLLVADIVNVSVPASVVAEVVIVNVTVCPLPVNAIVPSPVMVTPVGAMPPQAKDKTEVAPEGDPFPVSLRVMV